MRKQRWLQQGTNLVLITVFLVGCIAPPGGVPPAQTVVATSTAVQPTFTPDLPTPSPIPLTSTVSTATGAMSPITCFFSENQTDKISGTVISATKSADIKAKAKGVFLVVEVELTDLEESHSGDFAFTFVWLNLVDMKANTYNVAGTVKDNEFLPNQRSGELSISAELWAYGRDERYSTTVVFDVPPDASGFKLTLGNDCEVDLGM